MEEVDLKVESHFLLGYHATVLRKKGIQNKAIALCGDPRDAIHHTLVEIKADLLAVGSRGFFNQLSN